MNRYYLQSMEIGFEVPFLDIDKSLGTAELTNSIVSKYLSSFDLIKVGLKLYQLPNLNHVFLFYMVARVDSAQVSKKRSESDWSKLKIKITEDMEEFLKLNNLSYKKFD